jgi:tetratricopeptide (TPR) repeat protein
MLHRSETVIRQQIPLKPEVFHGRDSVVEEIAQLLTKEETSRVCILGPGGMGKTSVLLAVVELPLITERFPGENCVWVPCIEATSATLFLEILYIQLQVPGEMHVTLERIISELDTSKLPRLLLLDNFETPWNASGKTQKQIGDILRKLAALSHIAILVTMRGTYPPCDMIRWQPQTIQPINEAASYHIFLDINPNSKDDPDVGCLLAVLGHMPFAITLMANLGKRGKSTAKELLNTWYISGTNMLSATNSPERSINQSISLSVDSEFVKQDPDALLLLAILSMLPAGTTRQNLCWWAPTIKIIPSAIATLCDAALLVETRQQNSSPPVFFVLPVVQSFMHQQDRITEAVKKQVLSSCCQYISDHACRYYDDSTYAIKSKALIIEDTNIQSILFGSSTVQHIHFSNTTIEAFIAFCWHCCDTKPNLEIANHIVTIAKASMIDKYIASAVWCLGRTYHQLSDYNLSYGHLQKAHQLFLNALCLANGDLKLQQLSAQCAIDLVDTACMALQNADEIVSLARDVETQCAALSDNFIHGQSLVFLGRALNIAHKWKEALSYLNRAQIMLLAVGNTSNLAITYQLIARVYHYEKRLPEALNAIEEAWKYAEMTSSLYIQGIISREFCTILFSANRGMEAWKYAEIALEKASHVANQLTVAHALQYMGYGYLHKGDYQNAYDAYEAAADKYHGTVNAILGETCRDNVAKIQQKQNNPDAIIGFYRPDFDLDKSLFYPSPPESLFSLSK